MLTHITGTVAQGLNKARYRRLGQWPKALQQSELSEIEPGVPAATKA